MVTAAIAYDVLKRDNPRTIPKALALLAQHPPHPPNPDVLRARIESVPAAGRDRYPFMVVARWADDVRNQPKYHEGPWHYVNFPVVAKADEATFSPPQPAGPSILTALTKNTEAVGGDGPAAGRAVALCWAFHLVGDLHQPLHVVSYFSRGQWPTGDRGGNGFFVRARADRAVINLHSLWDGLILGSERYQSTGNAAIELQNRPAFAREKLVELEAAKGPKAWADESYKVAVEVAYWNRTLAGGDDKADGLGVPDD
jgi:hypothetical protein